MKRLIDLIREMDDMQEQLDYVKKKHYDILYFNITQKNTWNGVSLIESYSSTKIVLMAQVYKWMITYSRVQNEITYIQVNGPGKGEI